MIKYIGIILSLILIFSSFALAATVEENLVAHISFNDSVTDSANNYDGAITGDLTFQEGIEGKSIYLDGLNNYVSLGNLGYFNKGTISYWYKYNYFEDDRVVFSTEPGWDDNWKCENTIGQNESGIYGTMSCNALGTCTSKNLSEVNIPVDQWHHVVISFDQEKSVMYLNGEKVYDTELDCSQLGISFNSTRSFQDVTIGNGYSTYQGRMWRGNIDEVRIYNTNLNEDSVTKLYNLAEPTQDEDTNNGHNQPPAITVQIPSGNSSGSTGTLINVTTSTSDNNTTDTNTNDSNITSDNGNNTLSDSGSSNTQVTPVIYEPTCIGCDLNIGCLPFGTRLVSEEVSSFCGIAGNLASQKIEEATCQNNYECLSNQCSNGFCVDIQREVQENRGLIQSILDGIASFFGIA